MNTNSVLSYLPPGWTEETYRNRTDKDSEALSEEELQKVMNRSAAESRIEARQWVDTRNKHLRVVGRPLLTYEEMGCNEPDPSETEAKPMAPGDYDVARANLDMLVLHIETEGWKEFGFWAIRVHYSDDTLWHKFRMGFFELVDEGIAAVPADSGFHSFDDVILTQFLDDDDFTGIGPEGVSHAYELCMENADEPFELVRGEGQPGQDYYGSYEPGMLTKMCLMVDEECMRSVAEPKPDVIPFVKAVDVTLHRHGEQGTSLPYSGWFKVAVTSLIPKFYAALLQYDPAEVAATAGDDDLWTDIGSFDQDRESRHILRIANKGI